MERSLAGNLRVLDVLFAAQGALFWIPVFVLYLSGTQTPEQILRLEAVYYAAVVVLEVPSGWASDVLGRRATLVLSGLGWTIGAVVIGLSGTFALFALAQVCLAAGRAFASGTDSSVLYETLEALGQADRFREQLARATSLGFGMLAIGAVGGGLLGAVDLRLPYAASAVGGLVATVAALAIVEPPRATSDPTAPGKLAELGGVLRDPVVQRMLAFVVLLTVLTHVPYELQQPWLKLLFGVDGAAVASGMVVALSFGCASLASRRAGALVELLGGGTVGVQRGLAASAGFLGVVMAAMAAGPYLAVVPLLAVRSVPTGLLAPLVDAELHPRLPSGVRATWLSVQSLAGRLVFAAVLLVASLGVGDAWTLEALRRLLVPMVALAAAGLVAGLVWRPR